MTVAKPADVKPAYQRCLRRERAGAGPDDTHSYLAGRELTTPAASTYLMN